jgi:3-hydroxyacyl-CoA dehydrogenase/enoyl-CoA hydratase/3-hydroxybutyryl-CoA epimerase
MMLNEAARCLDEGVIRSARDGDIGAIFGIGFPPFLGGPFRYMDQLGAAKVVERLNYYADKVDAKFKPAAVLETMATENTAFY